MSTKRTKHAAHVKKVTVHKPKTVHVHKLAAAHTKHKAAAQHMRKVKKLTYSGHK